MGSRTLAVLLLATGCASTGPAHRSLTPGPFEGMKRLILIREVDRPYQDGRPKDAIDAVREALEASGRVTRTVDVSARRGSSTTTPAADLFQRVGERRPTDTDFNADRVDFAGPILADLQVDGAVVLFRWDLSPDLPPMSLPGAGGAPAVRARPVSSLALVDRYGNLQWFHWFPADVRLTGKMQTPGEAVEALVRVVSGQEAEQPGT
ncbi:MAG TPA: hypothetical protein VML50_01235 [Anaeromyxobacter sp.]|nr:hypothetical protein [Anaeromyxobacter sp.]